MKKIVKDWRAIMKLYRIYQNKNNDYDTYSRAVVCAESEEEAKLIHPNGWSEKGWWINLGPYDSWVHPDKVQVEYLGEACESLGRGIICASYHAG